MIGSEKENSNSDTKSPDGVNSPKHNKEPLDLILNAVSSDQKVVICKHEDASSAKSDVFDSDSPHYTDGNNSTSLLEPADSSHGFEPDQSDFSQDEEDENLLNLPRLPKVEEDGCYGGPHENSCNFGFQVEEQTFCFWPF